MRYIDPVNDIGELLLKTEKPGRYAGGEYGIFAKKDADLKTAIAFPDLYEIGMGNQALRIIYNRLNKLSCVSCDRVFAPAPDFEKLLRKNNIPLYGLDTGIVLSDLDLLLFTLGYELGINGVLTILDVSGIPLKCEDRKENSPVVIAGGPVVSNPLPFSPFIDAFWIGEAEAGFFELTLELAKEKSRGAARASLLKTISAHPNIWVKGKKNAKRAVYTGFSSDVNTGIFPIPSMKIVQNHGTSEIMRGCPNGCRFCHAGYWYRPMRQKDSRLILLETDELIKKGGWQEVSLSSLSSGDYCGISELIDTLNERYTNEHVSFQLPSLKVSGFSLNILEKISVTRKSGLTFAVETPNDLRQMSINKEVTRDSVAAILEEAKKRGWKSAKFYFMVGLPNQGTGNREQGTDEDFSEEKEIVEFILDISKRSRMKFNINVGVFIPKPHTPYQWAAQIDSDSAKEKLYYIRSKLKPLGHKVSTSDLLIAKIEGLLSRGDERAGEIALKTYIGGSRLDAWDDYINREKWEEILSENEDYLKEINSPQMRTSYGTDYVRVPKVRHRLYWNCIQSGASDNYLQNELDKSNNCERTIPCAENCQKCGICNNEVKIQKNTFQSQRRLEQEPSGNRCATHDSSVNQRKTKVNSDIYRLIFSFSKQKSAVFHGHLSLIGIFSMSLKRAGIPVLYTHGFNPLAKIEFASPLSLGISSDGEIASCDFTEPIDVNDFIDKLNKNFPDGLCIHKAEFYKIRHGIKQHSLSSLLWGFAYEDFDGTTNLIPANEEKKYRLGKKIASLCRKEVLAKNINNINSSPHESYFNIYRSLYNVF